MSSTLDRKTYPLWECLSAKALVLLVEYQWRTYGLRLDLMCRFPEIEKLPELEHIMKQRPKAVSRSRK